GFVVWSVLLPPPPSALRPYTTLFRSHYGLGRERQDEFAVRSLTRAMHAIDSGAFDAEVTPVTVKQRKGEHVVRHDEQPHKASLEDRKSTRLNSSHVKISYAVFCLQKT